MTQLLAVDRDVDDYLEHYGVKGMKWGVRKDRNKSSGTKREASASSSNAKPKGGSSDSSLGERLRKAVDPKNRAKAKVARAKRKASVAKAEADSEAKVAEARTKAAEARKALEKAEASSKSNSDDPLTRTRTTDRSNTAHMTDKQLQDTINRMYKEAQYTKMISELTPKTNTQKMMEWGKKTMVEIASAQAKKFLNDQVSGFISNSTKKALDDVADAAKGNAEPTPKAQPKAKRTPDPQPKKKAESKSTTPDSDSNNTSGSGPNTRPTPGPNRTPLPRPREQGALPVGRSSNQPKPPPRPPRDYSPGGTGAGRAAMGDFLNNIRTRKVPTPTTNPSGDGFSGTIIEGHATVNRVRNLPYNRIPMQDSPIMREWKKRNS